MFKTSFLTAEQAQKLATKHGTPLYVYSSQKLEEAARAMLGVPAPFGLTIRFAMKANPHESILKTFKGLGIKIDASSGYEAERAIAAGFAPEDMLLTSQQIPNNLRLLVEQGVQYNATSFRQLETFGDIFGGLAPYNQLSVRINPGIGSGHSTKANVGGITSSFGIWHEYIPRVLEIADKLGVVITRLHTHIGSGADPKIWQEAAAISLDIARQFPDVKTLNLGGGFKVARVKGETGVDMNVIGKVLTDHLRQFAVESDRELHLELEPGTFLVANAGILLSRVEDIVDTGKDGYKFIKLNTGMNDILRPGLYGAQHPIAVINDSAEKAEYVVVGHNCESGDLLTPERDNPDVLKPRLLNKAEMLDTVAIGGVGAYCASMATHGYNSYPDAKEIIVE